MVYRIRYELVGMDRQDTKTIEANSPSEAMIKFDLEYNQGHSPSLHTITSVCAEETLLEAY